MFHLITNANIYSPAPLGIGHILIAAGKIAYIGSEIPDLGTQLITTKIDAEGAIVAPGMIDAHTHLTGGGGESGPASRVPALPLSRFTKAGVTSVVGVLGTDDLTRNTQTLVTQCYGLRAEGLSAWCHTGGYHVPLMTLTGSARSDIVNIDPVIGIGELAISDHRSSQPTLEEVLRIASEAHVAGLMTGKAGIVHFHLGDGSRRLELVREAITGSEIPARVFNPTHVNRNKDLFEEALGLPQLGCTIDVTAFPDGMSEGGYSALEAFQHYHERNCPPEQLTFSSDGGGCLPTFDDQGNMTHMGIGCPGTMTETLRALIKAGVPIDQALAPLTSNVARLLKLHGKGKLATGMDADLMILDKDTNICDVMAMGRWHIKDGDPILLGTFENPET